MKLLSVIPLDLAEANAFIEAHHRHHGEVVGHKFSLGADQKGVVITDVSPNSPAAERGLKSGDVIVEVQQGAVTSPADVQQKVDSVKKENRKSVLMLIQRPDGLQWVPLSLSSDKDKQPG